MAITEIANHINQTYRAPLRADIERAKYGNALMRGNAQLQQQEIVAEPDRAKMRQLDIQGEQQRQSQNAQAFSQEQIANARGIAAQGAAAVAQSANPLAAYRQLINNPQWMAAAKAAGWPVDQFTFDGTETAEQVASGMMDWARMGGQQMTQQKAEDFTLSPGQTRYGAGGQAIASAPVAPSAENGGFTLSPGQTRYGPDGRPVANAPAAPPNQSPGQNFEQAAKLRSEFNAQSANFRAATEGYQSVLAAASNPSAAGDVALIFSFMRTLDPNSTVREGEFATAQNSGGVPDRIRAQYNSILNGQRLSEDQRKDFVAQATNLYNGHRQGYDRLVAKYTDFSSRAGLDPADVVGQSLGIDTQQQPTVRRIKVDAQGNVIGG